MNKKKIGAQTIAEDFIIKNINDVVKHESPWAGAWRRFKLNRAGYYSLYGVILMILTVNFAEYLSPQNYYELHYNSEDLANIGTLKPPNWEEQFFFGTDVLGRDMYTRVLLGGRVSISVGFIAAIVCMIIGITYGAIAGYVQGSTDRLMMRIVDILYAMPFTFFVIMLMVLFERKFYLVFVAIGAVEWLDVARIVRGQTITVKNKEFIDAARTMGLSTSQVIIKHIFPNLMGPITVYLMLTVQRSIMIESFLGFLGLGVQEPLTSWGCLIQEGNQLVETAWWLLAFPALFLSITLVFLLFIGDGLRDAFDPKER